MARDLTPITSLHAQQLEAEAPWVWLYELETLDSPPKRYRLTNFIQAIEFGANAAGDRLRYSPAPIIHSDIEEGTDGSLPTITITVGHAGPLVGSTIDASAGFVGQPFRMSLVSTYELENPSAAVTENGEVVAATVTSRGIAFKVSAFNLYQLQHPPFLYARRRCRVIFGSGECGYNKDAAGAAFTSCTNTLEACEERGDDEVSRGLARLHPRRFGGWPGIPRSGR